MTTLITVPPNSKTLADLLDPLGEIAPQRIRLHPAPGHASEKDVLDLLHREKRLCELVDGILVEKPMGFRESAYAALLIRLIGNFVASHNLGVVTGPDGMVRLAQDLIRIPDVAFVSWDKFPNRRLPETPIPALAPDLAVEVLSAGNTASEMARKRRDYFTAGVRLVWLVDPVQRTVEVFPDPNQSSVHRDTDTLAGGEVLPGFTLSLPALFNELDPR